MNILVSWSLLIAVCCTVLPTFHSCLAHVRIASLFFLERLFALLTKLSGFLQKLNKEWLFFACKDRYRYTTLIPNVKMQKKLRRINIWPSIITYQDIPTKSWIMKLIQHITCTVLLKMFIFFFIIRFSIDCIVFNTATVNINRVAVARELS